MSINTPDRLFDYFTFEANEQLQILEEEASRETQPNAGRFIAAARKLTSSAQMARLSSLAEIAGGIERIARDMVRNDIGWSTDLREAVLGGLRELRVSVARVKELDEADYVRLRRHSREVLMFTREEVPALEAIPISRLFYSDSGPHIVRLAQDQPAPTPTPSASRGKALKDLLDASIARLGGSAPRPEPAAAPAPVIPVEQLLYRGRTALERARTIGTAARADNRTLDTDELSELFDLLELAATEGT